VFFDRPNEIEWINGVEVEAQKSNLWDMIFVVVVGMALISLVDVYA
jgi:hypothetical protein